MSRILQEVRKPRRRQHESLEEDVFLNIQRTADALMYVVSETLKRVDLSPPQYDALRILRRAGSSGLPCREVSKRMLARDPDVTRLVDRLENRGLVERSRDEFDRRVIVVRLSKVGEGVLEEIDGSVVEAIERRLAPLGSTRLAELNVLLDAIREQR